MLNLTYLLILKQAPSLFTFSKIQVETERHHFAFVSSLVCLLRKQNTCMVRTIDYITTVIEFLIHNRDLKAQNNLEAPEKQKISVCLYL